MVQTEVQKSGLTAQMILTKLEQRVSMKNAKLILDTARISSGVKVENGDILESQQAKALCLKLINQGGPAFHVGQAIYKEYLM